MQQHYPSNHYLSNIRRNKKITNNRDKRKLMIIKKMFGQFFSILQTIICFIIIASSFGFLANGASVHNYESTSMESFNMNEANDLKRYKLMEHNLFRSDGFTSSENHHDNANENYDDSEHDLPEVEEFNPTKQNVKNNTDWDVLIFTQQWPVTTCYHWRENNIHHRCNLPRKDYWTIHGIWPTKLRRIGPNFCNNSAKFDVKILDKILPNMIDYWPDIDVENVTAKYWLWQHEWLKHGTCAASIEQLNNELKYFGTGLNWRQNFQLSNILEQAGIYPDSNNTVVAIHAALLGGLGKNPSIHCLYDAKTETSFLAEIRICFNKTLELVNCDGVLSEAVSVDYPGGTLITNCHISKPVHYPSSMPGQRHIENVNEDKDMPSSNWKFPIVNLYKLIQFIMWFTL